MLTHQIPWQRRAPTLLLALLLHLLIVAVFLQGLTTAGRAALEKALLVSIVAPPPSRAPLPPALHAPKLAQTAPIPPLIPPAVSIPDVISVPAAPAPAPPPPKLPVVVRALSGSVGPLGDAPPRYVSAPMNADDYYPLESRLSFSQGRVWTRVCVYSTGDVASVSLLQTSGDRALDDAALTVARQTHWKPALAHGKPVARCSPFRVDFALNRIGFD